MKKTVIIVTIFACLLTGGYVYLRFHFLRAKDYKPVAAKAKSPLDLRPAVIAKLQQLVKDGSKGLYRLDVATIEPGLLASTLDVGKTTLSVDTPSMRHLDSLRLLPDNIITLQFDSLHVTGLSLADLLHVRHLDVSNITLRNPIINMYHKLRPYNKAKRLATDTLTLYQAIRQDADYVKIGDILISGGTLIVTSQQRKKTVNKFHAITLALHDILIDSSTQTDAARFLFAKHATLAAKNYVIPTADSMYYVKADDIKISAEQHHITFTNLELKPRYSREGFERRQQYRTNLYHVLLPQVQLYDADWLALMNSERVLAKKMVLPRGSYSIFFDKTLPLPKINLDNFPQQLLMHVAIPFSVQTVQLQHFHVEFVEYNPDTKRTGTALFDLYNSHFDHVSNITNEIKKHPIATATINASFMQHVPLTAVFTFNLAKAKTGVFTADIHMDSVGHQTLNPMAEALALFSIKRGTMQEATAHVEGDNFGTKGNIEFYYRDLHVTPLKKADASGKMKKRRITSFIANTLVIKKDNLKDGKARTRSFAVTRDHHENFFSLVWVSLLTGILETVGVPVKLVVH